jgi:galactose-1-phosphate uridylyltransferase
MGEVEFFLPREKLNEIIDSETIDSLTVEEIFRLFREERDLHAYLPSGKHAIDPRDGSVITFNKARSKRPHHTSSIPSTPRPLDGATDPICKGQTTRVIDVAALSKGFTFINKNLFPILYPFSDSMDTKSDSGLHFLQWTSSYYEDDWHNMSEADRVVVMSRLAALEKKLLFGRNSSTDQSAGYVAFIKNYGRLVGGSLEHGHQQILYTQQMPLQFANNEKFEKNNGKNYARYVLDTTPEELIIKDYGPGVLLTPSFMRRPYYAQFVLKDSSKQYLFQLNNDELAAFAQSWHDAIRAIRVIMPSIGRTTAYNITVSNGPGAGLYCDFLPYTQEMGGFEHIGFWVCQGDPEDCTADFRAVLKSMKLL